MFAAAITLLALAACSDERSPASDVVAGPSPALRIALAEADGSAAEDHAIRTAQASARLRADVPNLERLATLFIAKARISGDPGYYKQAEACAEVLSSVAGGELAGALLRGHVRHALHDFEAAEHIARDLVARRGMPLDLGLLGDVLLDLGRLDEAKSVYQRMLDLRPGLQSYARAGQIRWLAGDHDGCRELLEMASRAGSRRDPESLAWVLARSAILELHAGDPARAAVLADQALELVPEFPAARLARGRAALALEAPAEAAVHLAAAVAAFPLPEHLWAHADALRAAGRGVEAANREAELQRTGETEDPRTLALWLATNGRDPSRALRLAEAEFRLRQDPHTLDVLALARLGVGNATGAHDAIQRALACGVRDARIALHAALIAEAIGDRTSAERHRAAALAGTAALLPSERALLASRQ
jgi:tetratricopeptide (TPR) repeat protein